MDELVDRRSGGCSRPTSGPVIDDGRARALDALRRRACARGASPVHALRRGARSTARSSRRASIELAARRRADARGVRPGAARASAIAPSELDALIDAINALGYGLTLGIHTPHRRDGRAHRRARARVGNVYVNRNMIGAVVGVQPFGGEGLSGTGPKAGGPHYLPRFATERTFTINTAAVGGNATLLSLDTGPGPESRHFGAIPAQSAPERVQKRVAYYA